jgi:hypothetical protein
LQKIACAIGWPKNIQLREGVGVRIHRTEYKGKLVLVGKKLIEQIVTFPEHGMGYSLVDITLVGGSVIKQVPIVNGSTICFYDDMKQFVGFIKK